MRGTFPNVNFFATNCLSSSAVSSFLGVNKCSAEAVLLPPDDGREDEVPLCPKPLAASPNSMAPEPELELEPEPEGPKAGLPEAPAVPDGEEAGNPENPVDPKLKTSGLLNEKDAAETAAASPNPKEVGAEVVRVELEDAVVSAGTAGITGDPNADVLLLEGAAPKPEVGLKLKF